MALPVRRSGSGAYANTISSNNLPCSGVPKVVTSGRVEDLPRSNMRETWFELITGLALIAAIVTALCMV